MVAAVGIGAAKAYLDPRFPGQLQVAVMRAASLITLAGDRQPLESVVSGERRQVCAHAPHQLCIPHAHGSNRGRTVDVLAAMEPHVVQPSPRGDCLAKNCGGIYRSAMLPANRPVFFSDLQFDSPQGERRFLELGPHPALESSIVEVLSEQDKRGEVFHSLKRKRRVRAAAHESCSIACDRNTNRLASGQSIDWTLCASAQVSMEPRVLLAGIGAVCPRTT